MSEFLSTGEVSKMLGISYITARAMVLDGRLEGIVIPGEERDIIRVKREAVERILNNQHKPAS